MLKGNFGCGIANGVEEAPRRGEKAALLLCGSPGEGGGKGDVASGEKVCWFQVQEDGRAGMFPRGWFTSKGRQDPEVQP